VTFTQKIMRFISPACERQRQELRHSIATVNAHAEDMTRTFTSLRAQTLPPLLRKRPTS